MNRPTTATLRFLSLLVVLGLPFSGGVASAFQSSGTAREDDNSKKAHQQLIDKTSKGTIDIFFVGDSITRRWGATDYPNLLENWNQNFLGWNAANFGWGGDTTYNIIWRMKNGEFENCKPKIIVLQAGTNNLPWTGEASPESIELLLASFDELIQYFHAKSPDSIVVITAVFPRSQNPAHVPAIVNINKGLESKANGKTIRFLSINDRLGDQNQILFPGMSDDGLHLSVRAYQIWADALNPVFTEILGPRQSVDKAPPPTGDPKQSTTGKK